MCVELSLFCYFVFFSIMHKTLTNAYMVKLGLDKEEANEDDDVTNADEDEVVYKIYWYHFSRVLTHFLIPNLTSLAIK